MGQGLAKSLAFRSPINAALCVNMMKLLVIIIFALFSVSTFSNAIVVIDKTTHIKEGYEFKFGLERSVKTTKNDLYISINVDEKLLCKLKHVSALSLVNGREEYPDVLKTEGAYTIKIEKPGLQSVWFYFHCEEKSIIHDVYNFKYEVQLL